MRRYLKEFLSDRRVIEVPRLKWWPILNLHHPHRAPGRKGKDYDKIWNRERNEGPLKTITRAAGREARPPPARTQRIVVDWAMRYANPAVAERLAALQAQGCDRILLVPLYPQYAARHHRHRLRPGVPRPDGDALAARGARRCRPTTRSRPTSRRSLPRFASTSPTLDFEPEALIASFHGMPQKYLEQRRPLSLPVPEDVAARAREAGLARRRAGTRRSSRSSATIPGCSPTPSTPWSASPSRASSAWHRLRPASPPTAWRRWRSSTWRTGPGFLENGGEQFAYIPCLNDSRLGVRVIESVVRRELAGWV